MTTIKEKKINQFDGGVTRDLRVQSANKFKVTKNFDIFSDSKKLQPFRALEANETKNINITQFIQTNDQIYGYGTTAGASVAKIYKKSGDIITGDWTEDQNVEGLGAREENVFFEYKDYLYFWEARARLARHGDITGTSSNETYQTIAYTNVAQPVHHLADDIAYFFSDNKVHKLNDTSWTSDVLELPDNLIITSACAYGDYLAIACKSKELTGHSIVFLWDRDSSLTTISEKIDWGVGDLMIIAVLDGVLVGLSNISTNSTLGFKEKIHIKGYSGGLSFLRELDVDNTTTGDSRCYIPNGAKGVIKNGKLYFPLETGASADAKNYTGIWVVGRHEVGSPFAVTMAYKIDTDASSDQIQGFNIFQDYLFVAHSSDGSVDRTNDQEVYPTAIYESYIFTGDDSSQTKKLLRATVFVEPQPSGGTFTLKYKRDAESSWTTIFTDSTENQIRHTSVNIESDGSNLGLFKEVQFRIESTGGTVITGLKFSYEEIDDDK